MNSLYRDRYITSSNDWSGAHVGSVVRINPFVTWTNDTHKQARYMMRDGQVSLSSENKLFNGERTIEHIFPSGYVRLNKFGGGHRYCREQLFVKGVDYE